MIFFGERSAGYSLSAEGGISEVGGQRRRSIQRQPRAQEGMDMQGMQGMQGMF